MKWLQNRTSLLLVASVLAVTGLVYFQLSWINHSQKLNEELFNQRVSMAICSAVEKSGGCLDNEKLCASPVSATSSCQISMDKTKAILSDTTFHDNLRSSLDFYQIPLEYEINPSDGNQSSTSQFTTCIVSLPSEAGAEQSFLQIGFPDKEDFVLSKIKAMVIATILILLFTIGVLLVANWMLYRQKYLLQANVDFFNNMAHEFRTPLTNLGLATNMLIRKYETLSDDSIVSVMKHEISSLLAQVERVLHIAQVEDGDYPLEKESISILELLYEVREEVSIGLEQHNALLQIGPVPEDLNIVGDKMHLRNVFRNLVDNAIKYGGDRPRIEINVVNQKKGILISVKDNGIGFSSSDSRMIFEKFQRVNYKNSLDQKGFGIGLAYVKKMVEKHQGFVRATSEEKRGSTFDVFLPYLTI